MRDVGRKIVVSCAVACLVFLQAAAAWALLGEQLYFTAKTAPEGSLSGLGPATVVYLRWDMVEGALPAEIAGFIVQRDGVAIAPQFPAQGLLSAADIEALYAGSNQLRRRTAMIARLQQLRPGFTDFGQALFDQLSTDSSWGWAASRIDFNVARARYRGAIDRPPAGLHSYELLAVSTDPVVAPRRVGFLSLDTATVIPAPAAANLAQVRLARCDAPEAGKDQGALALNWSYGGNLETGALASALTLPAFDLYRSENPTEAITPTVRDIRQLAASAAYDSSGDPVLPGLVKVNDDPVMISGAAAKETGNQGWNPPFYQFYQDAVRVAQQGGKPGSRYDLYLVGRDFTGNYGETAALSVVVPDLRPPAAVWGVKAVPSTVANALVLRWPQATAGNYTHDHQTGRQYCNLGSYQSDGFLAWVPEDQHCADGTRFVVFFDVTEYLVYRFFDSQQAASFTDRDGDGYSDAAEQTVLSVDPPLTEPGTSCDAAAFPATGTSYLVATLPVTDGSYTAGGRKIMEYRDPLPATNKGTVYWYRIASRDGSGNVSPLSAPVRGFFPNRLFPKRPADNALTIGVPATDCVFNFLEKSQGQVPAPLALDRTGKAAAARFSCATNSGSWTITHPLNPIVGSWQGTGLTGNDCELLNTHCTEIGGGYSTLTVEFVDGQGQSLAAGSLAASWTRCPNFLHFADLSETCTDYTAAVTPGQVVDPAQWPQIDYSGSNCLKIYREIDGASILQETICPPFSSPVHLDLPSLGGNTVCLSVAEMLPSGEQTAKVQSPCVVIEPAGPPGPPQPITLTFTSGSDLGTVQWRVPQEPVIGSILEWYWKGADPDAGTTRFSTFVPHSGHTLIDGSIQADLALTAEQTGTGWQEEWCVRGRSVGASPSGSESGALSEWSPELCALRLPAAQTPSNYLSWPQIESPPKLGDLEVKMFIGDGTPAVMLSDAALSFSQNCIPLGQGDNCNAQQGNCQPSQPISSDCLNLCSQIEASVAGKLNFVVYRQHAAEDPATNTNYDDFIQVSPLINRVQCQVAFAAKEAVLEDPYLVLINGFFTDPDWQGWRMVFVDRFPHRFQDWYRYQLVYFNAKGEILGHRDTPWLRAL